MPARHREPTRSGEASGRKNKNRGYKKVRVWNDAIDYYMQTCTTFRDFPYELTDEEFEKLDRLAYKLENGLLKLVESLEQKRERGEWTDHLTVKESNAIYRSS